MLTNASIHVWTDSEIALHWLRKPIDNLKVFVANRVTRILDVASVDQFRHICSEENPADLISRGISAENLLSNKLWWQGPKMLAEDIENWPAVVRKKIAIECKDAPAEFREMLFTTIDHDREEDLIERRQSLESVCRITALVLRFCRRCYEPIRKKKSCNNHWLPEETKMEAPHTNVFRVDIDGKV